jgi:hypothetical protein
MMACENSRCVRPLRAHGTSSVASNREETRNVARYGSYLKVRVRTGPGVGIGAGTEQTWAPPTGGGARMRKMGHGFALGGPAGWLAVRSWFEDPLDSLREMAGAADLPL